MIPKTEAGPPPRVLCVDDNPDCADSAARLFQAMGFESRSCYDGETAVVLNGTFHPNICLLDLTMSGMGRIELALQLRLHAEWHPLLIVATTAAGDESPLAGAEAFDMHLVKPIGPDQLGEVVNRIHQAAKSAHVAAT
jgi:two-component system, OmpR family, response regulator